MKQLARFWVWLVVLLGLSLPGLAQDYNPQTPEEPYATRKLTLKVSPDNSGQVWGASEYKPGTSVWVRTEALTNYTFKHWKSDDSIYSSMQNFYLTMPKSDLTLTAVYDYVAPVIPDYDPATPGEPERPYVETRKALYLESEPAGLVWGWSISNGQLVNPNDQVTLSFYSYDSSNYKFLGWYKGQTLISTSASFTYTMPQDETRLTARFYYDPVTPGEPQKAYEDPAYVDARKNVKVYSDSLRMGTVQTTNISGGGVALAGSTVTATAVAKMGYTFDKWVDALGNQYSDEALISFVVTDDCTLKALFKVNQYKYTFKFWDHEISDTQDYGTAIVLPNVDPREGYTFVGWDPVVPATVQAATSVYEAVYRLNRHTVTFLNEDSTLISRNEYEYGTSIYVPTPTKKGYSFLGWWDANGEAEVPEVLPDYDLTYKAQFSINSYILRYVVDGEEYKRDTLLYGATITPEADLEKEGHTFSGWSTIPATMPAENLTINGSFKVKTYKVTYVVDSVAVSEQTVNYGETPVRPTDPVKEGYTFAGWSQKAVEGSTDGDLIYTATFTINSYKLVYKVDGVVYQTYTLEYGTKITTLPPTPIKEGYLFTGWSEIPQTMPAHDVEVTTTFAEELTLNFGIEVEEIKSGETYKDETTGISIKAGESSIIVVPGTGTVIIPERTTISSTNGEKIRYIRIDLRRDPSTNGHSAEAMRTIGIVRTEDLPSDGWSIVNTATEYYAEWVGEAITVEVPDFTSRGVDVVEATSIKLCTLPEVTGIDAVEESEPVVTDRKVLIGGRLVIIRNGMKFDIAGHPIQ